MSPDPHDPLGDEPQQPDPEQPDPEQPDQAADPSPMVGESAPQPSSEAGPEIDTEPENEPAEIIRGFVVFTGTVMRAFPVAPGFGPTEPALEAQAQLEAHPDAQGFVAVEYDGDYRFDPIEK